MVKDKKFLEIVNEMLVFDGVKFGNMICELCDMCVLFEYNFNKLLIKD